jgi:hypothetical protein
MEGTLHEQIHQPGHISLNKELSLSLPVMVETECGPVTGELSPC